MECRKSLVVGVGLLCGSLGCALPQAMLTPAGPPAQAPVADAPPVGKHKPKAETFVALGDYRESEAGQPNIAPQQQRDLHEQARKAYLKALEIDPSYLPAFTAMARLHSALHEHGKAVECYHKALKLHPEEAAVWFELGVCHSRNKEWAPALENLRQAVKLDPDNRPYATTFGFCLARAGKYDEAVEVFTKLDGKAAAYYKVARMAHHVKQDDLSLEMLRRALMEKPDFTEAHQLLQTLEQGPRGGTAVAVASAAG